MTLLIGLSWHQILRVIIEDSVVPSEFAKVIFKPVVRSPETTVTVVLLLAVALRTTICPEELIDHVNVSVVLSLEVRVPFALNMIVFPGPSVKVLPESMSVVKPVIGGAFRVIVEDSVVPSEFAKVTFKPVVRLPETIVTVVLLLAVALRTTTCPEELIDHVNVSVVLSLEVRVPFALNMIVFPGPSIKVLPESMAVVKPVIGGAFKVIVEDSVVPSEFAKVTFKPVVRLPETAVTVVLLLAVALRTTICPEELIDHVNVSVVLSLEVRVPFALNMIVFPGPSIKVWPESMAVVKPVEVAVAGLTVRVNACVTVKPLMVAVMVRG